MQEDVSDDVLLYCFIRLLLIEPVLLAYLDGRPTAYYDEVTLAVYDQFDIRVHDATASRVLQGTVGYAKRQNKTPLMPVPRSEQLISLGWRHTLWIG